MPYAVHLIMHLCCLLLSEPCHFQSLNLSNSLIKKIPLFICINTCYLYYAAKTNIRIQFNIQQLQPIKNVYKNVHHQDHRDLLCALYRTQLSRDSGQLQIHYIKASRLFNPRSVRGFLMNTLKLYVV